MDSIQFPQLNEYDFIDLYLGDSFSDYSVLKGKGRIRVPAPIEWEETLITLREWCINDLRSNGDLEFTLFNGPLTYRVTTFPETVGGNVFVLRRSEAIKQRLQDLSLPDRLVKHLLDENLKGLVLLVGDMASGKTTTAAATIVERLIMYGGFAISIEDPVETLLHGLHGDGRCTVLRASKKLGGYAEQLRRGQRSGVNMFHLAEARDAETANQAVRSSLAGGLIFVSGHGGTPGQGIERFCQLASSEGGNVPALLAQSLAAVIWLQLTEPQIGGHRSLISRSLIFNKTTGALRSKVSKSEFAAIEEEVERQRREVLWED